MVTNKQTIFIEVIRIDKVTKYFTVKIFNHFVFCKIYPQQVDIQILAYLVFQQLLFLAHQLHHLNNETQTSLKIQLLLDHKIG